MRNTNRPSAASRSKSPCRKVELMSSLRHRGRARKRLIWARCRGSQRTAPAARRQDILPACNRNATTTRMTRDLARSFSPSGAMNLLRPGIRSATMTMARLRARLVRVQGSGRCEESRHFRESRAPGEWGKIAQHQKALAGLSDGTDDGLVQFREDVEP